MRRSPAHNAQATCVLVRQGGSLVSLTTLDPRTALVLIDLQRGISSVLDPEALAKPVTAAAELAAAFRARSLPVVLVRVDFSPDRADAPRNRTGVSRPTGRPPAQWT